MVGGWYLRHGSRGVSDHGISAKDDGVEALKVRTPYRCGGAAPAEAQGSITGSGRSIAGPRTTSLVLARMRNACAIEGLAKKSPAGRRRGAELVASKGLGRRKRLPQPGAIVYRVRSRPVAR